MIHARGMGALFALAILPAAPRMAHAMPTAPFLGPFASSDPRDTLVAFCNDGFGPGPVREWDDLDSYGFAAAVALPQGLAADLELAGLTCRGESPASGSRIDRVTADLRWSPEPSSLGPIAARPVVYAGLLAFGEFGAIVLQEGWHSGSGIFRPVPLAYEGGMPVSAIGGIGCELGLASAGGLSPSLRGGAEASTDGTWLLSASAGLYAGSASGGMRLELGWTSGEAGGAPAPFAAVVAAEMGPWLALSGKAGWIAGGVSYWRDSGISSGWIGIRLGSPAVDASGDLSLAFGLSLGSAPAPFYRAELELARPTEGVALACRAALANGWMLREASGASAPRFSEYSAGFLARFGPARGWASASVGAGARLSFESSRSLDVDRSEILASRSALRLDLEGDIRLAVPGFPAGAPGLGISLRYSPVGTVLSRMGLDFPSPRPLTIGAFAFARG